MANQLVNGKVSVGFYPWKSFCLCFCFCFCFCFFDKKARRGGLQRMNIFKKLFMDGESTQVRYSTINRNNNMT